MKIEPIAGALGAEINGIDLAGDLGDGLVAAIRRALLDHLVIFFHDQHLTPACRFTGKRCIRPDFVVIQEQHTTDICRGSIAPTIVA